MANTWRMNSWLYLFVLLSLVGEQFRKLHVNLDFVFLLLMPSPLLEMISPSFRYLPHSVDGWLTVCLFRQTVGVVQHGHPKASDITFPGHISVITLTVLPYHRVFNKNKINY